MNDYISKPVDERLLFNKIILLARKPSMKQKSNSQEGEPLHTEPCINLDYLTRTTKSNAALMIEMISLYIEQTPPYIKAMKDGLKNKDLTVVRAAIHKMIPTFSIVGIDPVYEVKARRIHELCDKNRPNAEIGELVLKIEAICVQACKELTIEIRSLKKTIKSKK